MVSAAHGGAVLCRGVGSALIRVVGRSFGSLDRQARGAVERLLVADLYLVRHGAMGHVGRFAALAGCPRLERGGLVVLQTGRGRELGEVLAVLETRRDGGYEPDSSESVGVLRAADRDDEQHGRIDDAARADLFALCRRVLAREDWPAEIVDIDVLLDLRTTVLHYLGPRPSDPARLRARFRMEHDLEVILESAGEHDPEPASGCGSGCGNGGGVHGASGGCGSGGGGCGSCSTGSCAVAALAKKRLSRNQSDVGGC